MFADDRRRLPARPRIVEPAADNRYRAVLTMGSAAVTERCEGTGQRSTLRSWRAASDSTAHPANRRYAEAGLVP